MRLQVKTTSTFSRGVASENYGKPKFTYVQDL